MRRLFLAITLATLQSEQCRVACMWAGFDSGDYYQEQCRCWDMRSYETMTNTKRLVLKTPRAPWKPQAEAPAVPRKTWFDAND